MTAGGTWVLVVAVVLAVRALAHRRQSARFRDAERLTDAAARPPVVAVTWRRWHDRDAVTCPPALALAFHGLAGGDRLTAVLAVLAVVALTSAAVGVGALAYSSAQTARRRSYIAHERERQLVFVQEWVAAADESLRRSRERRQPRRRRRRRS